MQERPVDVVGTLALRGAIAVPGGRLSETWLSPRRRNRKIGSVSSGSSSNRHQVHRGKYICGVRSGPHLNHATTWNRAPPGQKRQFQISTVALSSVNCVRGQRSALFAHLASGGSRVSVSILRIRYCTLTAMETADLDVHVYLRCHPCALPPQLQSEGTYRPVPVYMATTCTVVLGAYPAGRTIVTPAQHRWAHGTPLQYPLERPATSLICHFQYYIITCLENMDPLSPIYIKRSHTILVILLPWYCYFVL